MNMKKKLQHQHLHSYINIFNCLIKVYKKAFAMPVMQSIT